MYRNITEMDIRLSTFGSWPVNASVSAVQLVANGFVCIDSRQQKVECEKCGLQIVIPDLVGTDVHEVHREQSQDCPSALGGSQNNPNNSSFISLQSNSFLEERLPVHSLLVTNVETRRQTFRHQNWTHQSQTDAFIAAGFYFTGSSVITCCKVYMQLMFLLLVYFCYIHFILLLIFIF